MDAQIIEDIIAGNPEKANEPLVIYYAQTISTSITMPLATRNAFIKAWNIEFKRLYGAKPEVLWLKDLALSVVAPYQSAAAFMPNHTPPVDILFDHLESVTIELTQGWQKRFYEGSAELEVKCEQAKQQISGLIQATVEAMVKQPILPSLLNFENLADFEQSLKMYNAQIPVLNDARISLIPQVVGIVRIADVGRFTSGYGMVNAYSLEQPQT
ncbi:MAG: hypothetical protein ACI9TY_000959 [Alphaproteobacteria bacterium]|jgi:hypothetical protein